MSWMPTPRRPESHRNGTKEAILANVHRGLLLASASRRLQDSISSQRANAEARQLLTVAKRLCEQAPDLDADDERVRFAIQSLTQALGAG
jgi:hypothetical protein